MFEEAKFIAITEACKELLWLKKFLQELGFRQDKYSLSVDSQSVIHLGKNPTFYSRFKHIVRYHWIRDALDAKLLELEKVHTDDNGADMMTKALPRGKFEVCCEMRLSPHSCEGEICWVLGSLPMWRKGPKLKKPMSHLT